MSSPRHRAAAARPSVRTWFRKHLGPVVVSTSLTAMVVGVGVVGAQTEEPEAASTALRAGAGNALDSDLAAFEARGERASRTAKRITLQPQAVDRKWATANLNVWTGPGERFRHVGLVEAGTRLAVTGQVQGGWAEVLLKGDGKGRQVRWVNNEFLSAQKPQPPEPEPEPEVTQTEESESSTSAPSSGLSTAPCPHGTAIEAGLTDAADAVYRAVCAAFPQPTTYGGRDPHGEHYDGRAIDIMVSGELGWTIARWLRDNASALQVRTIIYAQRIWTPERSAEGWRYMSDRGSTTANHYDHVHVSVY